MPLSVSNVIALRPLAEKHVEEIYQTICRERAYLRVWLPFVDATDNVDFTRKYVRSVLLTPDPQFAIFYKETFVGLIGFKGIDAANKRTEIGYWMSQHASGKGIMTLSTAKLVEYAFTTMKMHRVQIRVAVGNVRSARIPERLGFRFEGIERDGELLVDNKYTDVAVYSKLSTEK
ncbi:MAG: GNAT family N-acetyltransferase [Prevotellaceae bacterium]|nr:GNAT family N-acetyltransferase [Prevotellaceae bacterium]